MRSRIDEAIDILRQAGLPKAQLNERTALCFLALAQIGPQTAWKDAQMRLLGITPIMQWVNEQYGRQYAPNTRETFRKGSMHQMVDSGLVLYNPDEPNRPVNSPHTVYMLSPNTMNLISKYGSKGWDKALATFLKLVAPIQEQFSNPRKMQHVPLVQPSGKQILLSPGKHSELIAAVIQSFGPCFAPGAHLCYVGDTQTKGIVYNEAEFSAMGITLDAHGKMPDVILHDRKKNWLYLVEAVTTNGPVDNKRHRELKTLFGATTAGIVYVTAFLTRADLSKFIAALSWETEVWIAEEPDHLIHLNGERFQGPY